MGRGCACVRRVDYVSLQVVIRDYDATYGSMGKQHSTNQLLNLYTVPQSDAECFSGGALTYRDFEKAVGAD